jgi:hypothetical protein
MKPAVRSKVANGLIIFLLVPRVADTAMEAMESYGGMLNFTADDEFEVTAEASSVAVAHVRVGEEEDPSGGDPTGGDPTGCDPSDPSGGDPSGGGGAELVINAPTELVTAEDGSSDIFEVLMEPDPRSSKWFYFNSTDPDEARPEPEAVRFGENACFPKTIRVVGQNDGEDDPSGGDPSGGGGDPSGGSFGIEIRDEQNLVVATIPGRNFDNDNYSAVAVDVLGPRSVPNGSDTVFTVFVANLERGELVDNTLLVEPSPGFAITGYAASLLSGNKLKLKGKIKDGVLRFNGVDLPGGDKLMVAVNATLINGADANQKMTARFLMSASGLESDDDQRVRTSVP